MDEDSVENCERITYEPCRGKNKVVDHKGKCVDKDEYIKKSHPNGKGGKYVEKLKIVEPNEFVDPDEICDEDC